MKKIKELFKKNKVTSIIVSVLVIAIIIFCTVRLSSAMLKSENLLDNQMVDSIYFENPTIVTEEGLTTFDVTVKNMDKKIREFSTIEITFNSKDGKLVTLTGYIGTELKENETKKMSVVTDFDLSSAKTISYKIK